jgi:6-phosphogluconolactonase (cycloisomerase 2 family)
MTMRRNSFIGVLCIATACADPSSRDDEAGTETLANTDGSTTNDSSGGADAADSTAGSDADSGPDSDTTTRGNDSESGDTQGESEDSGGEEDVPGMVFALGNAQESNAVVMFSRDAQGQLERVGEFVTGGHGSGDGLGSQGAMALDADEQYLYVVNAGDDTVSSMRIYDDHVALVDIVGSEGVRPTSLALDEGRIYVMNADGAGSVAGFEIQDGMFTPIEGAMRPLSGHEAPAPAQIAITPDGDFLVLTERATNQIVTYAIDQTGALGEPVVNASEGQTPFGFEFTSDGVFVVSEAFGGGDNPGASAASSYRTSDGGSLWTFSASVPSGQTAACWIAIVRDRYAYTTNTASNTLSAYEIDEEGAITLFPDGGVVEDLGDEHGPIDMAVSADEAFLYVINAAADNIIGYAVADDGSLSRVGDPTAVPETAVGLAGF